jgi:[FeFe] hydrogenase H-cluster maturation GTPase HydF
MRRTPKSLRLHIAIFGRRNVGKSSVLNALTGQDVAIVSDVAGTTTDPVEKPMELLPLGPVLFVDTAGYDDVGVLGELRTRKTAKVLERTEIALLVTEADVWGQYEETWCAELKRREIPTLVVLNKIDLAEHDGVSQKVEALGLSWTAMSATGGTGVLETKQAIVRTVPDDWYKQAGILDGIIAEGDTVVMVVPIDKEAPKGRIILPQVQTLRDILDKRARALVTNEVDVQEAIESLKTKPELVITDSQVFQEVAQTTPTDIPMTSFSIAFARYKGDLNTLADGARRINTLKETDKVLICEACTHHPIGEDIGRKKIPRWLRAKVGDGLRCDVTAGHDLPDSLSDYSLVIHCGACMFNRREMLSRIITCQEQGVPVTNYGVAIAHIHGILDRALVPFERGNAEGTRTLGETAVVRQDGLSDRSESPRRGSAVLPISRVNEVSGVRCEKEQLSEYVDCDTRTTA